MSCPCAEFQAFSFSNLFISILLAGKGLDHAHAGQVLLQGGGEHGFLFLVGFVGLGDAREEEDRDDQNEGNHDDRNQASLAFRL